MKDVQQKTCSAGVQTVFTMLLRRSQFLVKNFTNNQITVQLGNNDSAYPYGVCIGSINEARIRIKGVTNKSELAEYLVSNNVFLLYTLQTQIEEELTTEQAQAFKELVTYYPVTIIENNYNTWMKATYKSIESV